MPTHPRFRLRTLLLWVAFVAVACAGVFTPSYWWTFTLKVLVVCFCGVSLTNGIVCRGDERVYWLTVGIVSTALCAQTLIISLGNYERGLLPMIVDLRISDPVEARELLTRFMLDPQTDKIFFASTAADYAIIPIISALSGYFCRWVWERGRQDGS